MRRVGAQIVEEQEMAVVEERGPMLSESRPTTGPTSATVVLMMGFARENVVRDQPRSSAISFRNTGKR